MIAYKTIIERIQALLTEGSEASVTYAALEARLALEKLCYDRLRQRHDYISHSQLKKWQPGAIVATLMNDVDPHVAQTVQFSMAKQPAKGVKADPQDFVQLGTEVGFDPKRIVKLWNALAKLALHVRLPEHRNDHLPDYGDATQIRAKVEEVVAELEKLAEGNLSLSGIGETVSFKCGVCDEVNKRRVALLRDGQSVNCINPKCEASWKALKKGDGFVFQFEGVDFDCQGCGEAKRLPTRFLLGMKYNQRATFECNACSHRNYVEWRLTQVAPESEAEPS